MFLRTFDPDNRLVADSLEAEWNSKLRTLTEAQQNRERQREQDRKVLSDQQRAAILSLATDFPRLWRDPNTPDRERKRMIRLLLEDVTLVRGEKITLHIRFKGGATKTLMVPAPLNAWQQRATNPAVVKEIDSLLDHHPYQQIAYAQEKESKTPRHHTIRGAFRASITQSDAKVPDLPPSIAETAGRRARLVPVRELWNSAASPSAFWSCALMGKHHVACGCDMGPCLHRDALPGHGFSRP